MEMVSKRSFAVGKLLSGGAAIGLAVFSLVAHGAETSGKPGLRSETVLAGGWKIQPATSPDVAPREGDWGKANIERGIDWRNAGAASAEGTSWAASDRTKINSLWYEVGFSVSSEHGKKRVLLDFPRMEGDAIIFVNGQRVGEVLAPGGEIDISGQIQWDKPNQARIFVTRDYSGISRSFQDDALRYQARAAEGNKLPMEKWALGISQPPLLVVRPAEAITDIFCLPSWRQKGLELQVGISSEKAWKNGTLVAEILNEKGEKVLEMSAPLPEVGQGSSTHRIFSKWADPILWELDKPYLYTVRVKLLDGQNVADEFPDVRFGFREIWTEGREIMLNGHPSRWRLTDLYGANANAVSFYQLIGFNVGQIQPHPQLWWREWSDTPVFDEHLLDELDRKGMGCTMPAPGTSFLGNALVENPKAREQYRREMEFHMLRYRNHPSILAWAVGMNVYNPTSNISPGSLGKREITPSLKGQVVKVACETAKQLDRSRLAFSHGDGSIGDISTANAYLNFAPLQEREEWPMEWAKNGDMPYGVVEFGPPYVANFWKGKQFLLTEYLAMYLGDEAYRLEGEDGLRQTMDFSLANLKGHGAWRKVYNTADPKSFAYPAYWDFQKLFVRNTNRSWRLQGINAGFLYFNLDGYGDPGKVPLSTPYLWRYKLTAPVTEKPSWANPNFEIHQQANKPLLAYLAGAPAPTDKTHSFFAGESFEKQIAVVWDGPEAKAFQFEWSLKRDGATLQEGAEGLTLKPGDKSFLPLKLRSPKDVTERTGLVLSLHVKDGETLVSEDQMPIEIFPRQKPLHLAGRWAIYDPSGKTKRWVDALGVTAATWKPGDSLERFDVLLIGREALKIGTGTPYSAQDIERGLRVVIFEQQPAVWEMLGFELAGNMARYVFARDLDGPVLQGLLPADLINWRGSPDLLPEGRLTRTFEHQHAPKWTNRHTVASLALKTPEIVGFTPILQTEFDLAYSPLLEWRSGRGSINFCSLDLTDRVGVDPAATHLAANLLKSLQRAPEPTRRVYYDGNPKGLEWLRRLQAEVSPGEPEGQSLLVLGNDARKFSDEWLDSFVRQGGTIVHLPETKEVLEKAGFRTEHKEIVKVSEGRAPVLRAIGPNLLRWRDVVAVDAFTPAGQPPESNCYLGGLLLVRQIEKGQSVFLQMTSDALAARYPDDADRREAIQLSIPRINQLSAQILTNLGATPSAALAKRLTRISTPKGYRSLGAWKVLGPHYATGTSVPALMKDRLPGEEDALLGGENPNLIYPTLDGRSLDWRKTVEAGENGYVDLAKDLKAEKEGVAFVTRGLKSDKSRMVRLRFGADYFLRAWMNGKEILTVDTGHGAPAANAFSVDALLKAGDNILTLKVGSGSKGFGFWADICENLSAASNTEEDSTLPPVNFYTSLSRPFDPYQFHYW